MRKNKGFTLVELMVVILIVAILAAVLAPMMTGRIREAKWSEGKAAAGTIATGLRAWLTEQGGNTATPGTAVTHLDVSGGTANSFQFIGVEDVDLAGKHFSASNYAVTGISYAPDTGVMQFVINVTPPTSVGGTTARRLTVNTSLAEGLRSVWTEYTP